MQLCSTQVQKKGALDSQPQVEKVCHLLALGRWFSPGIPASSTTKTGRHDMKNNTQKPDWVKYKYKYDNTK
jgi:hypothetical protein